MSNDKTAMKLFDEIQATRKLLTDGSISVDHAQADARLFTVMIKTVSIMLEHAKKTERLGRGSSELPDFTIVEGKSKCTK
jgi:hypothetical protein